MMNTPFKTLMPALACLIAVGATGCSSGGGGGPTAPPLENNFAPVISDIPDVVEADSDGSGSELVRISAIATDPDDDPNDQTDNVTLQYSWMYNGQQIGSQHILEYQFDIGDHTVSLMVSDGQFTDVETFSVIVGSPPQFVSVPEELAVVGEEYNYGVIISDDSGEPITFTLQQAPVWLELRTVPDSNAAALVGTPALTDIGTSIVTIEASNAILTSTQTYALIVQAVTQVNNPPVITTEMLPDGNVDVPFIADVAATDADADVLVMSVPSRPDWMTFVDNGNGSLTLTGTPDQEGQFEVVVEAFDGTGATDQTFSFNVFPVVVPPNSIPTLTGIPTNQLSAFAGNEFTVSFTADDADGDSLTFTTDPNVDPAPEDTDWLDMTVDGNTVTLSGVPAESDVGVRFISVGVADDKGGEASQSFFLDVKSVASNNTPEITTLLIDSASVGIEYSQTITAVDPDDDFLVFTALQLPDWLTAVDNGDGTFALSGTPTAQGDFTVEVSVTDGAAVATRTYDLSVQLNNVRPAFTSTPVSPAIAYADNLFSYEMSASDADGDALTFSAVSTLPAWLTLVDNGDGTAVLSGTPAATDAGSPFIILQVLDENGGSATQDFVLNVSAELPPVDNDPPQLSVSTIPNVWSTPYSTVGASVIDPDGDPLTITYEYQYDADTSPAEEVFIYDADSSEPSVFLRFPVNGTYILRVTAHDGISAPVALSFAIRVNVADHFEFSGSINDQLLPVEGAVADLEWSPVPTDGIPDVPPQKPVFSVTTDEAGNYILDDLVGSPDDFEVVYRGQN
jgi:hypothetical protein